MTPKAAEQKSIGEHEVTNESSSGKEPFLYLHWENFFSIL